MDLISEGPDGISLAGRATPAGQVGPDAGDVDRRLVERIRDGDRHALGTLYDRYASSAMGVAMVIVRRREVAEDVVHDAFLSCWRRIRTFDPARGSVRSWLLVIVRNRAIDKVRADRPTMEIGEADEQSLLRTDHDPTLRGVLEGTTAADLRDAIGTLPEEQRRAIELAYFEGHTYREVAAMAGVPVGTANGRMRLALHKLRAALSDG